MPHCLNQMGHFTHFGIFSISSYSTLIYLIGKEIYILPLSPLTFFQDVTLPHNFSPLIKFYILILRAFSNLPIPLCSFPLLISLLNILLKPVCNFTSSSPVCAVSDSKSYDLLLWPLSPVTSFFSCTVHSSIPSI